MTYHNAHAAKIVSNVVRKIVVIPYLHDDDDEITAYCNSIGLQGTWIDCSFLGARRGKYPAVGDIYDAELDQFVTPDPPQPTVWE